MLIDFEVFELSEIIKIIEDIPPIAVPNKNPIQVPIVPANGFQSIPFALQTLCSSSKRIAVTPLLWYSGATPMR